MYNAKTIGLLEDVREEFVVISPERKVKHTAVVDIIERARTQLFN